MSSVMRLSLLNLFLHISIVSDAKVLQPLCHLLRFSRFRRERATLEALLMPCERTVVEKLIWPLSRYWICLKYRNLSGFFCTAKIKRKRDGEFMMKIYKILYQK